MSYRSLIWLLGHTSNISLLRRQAIPSQVFRLIACRAYGTDNNDKKPFISLLNNKNVRNPFSDPSRTKQKGVNKQESFNGNTTSTKETKTVATEKAVDYMEATKKEQLERDDGGMEPELNKSVLNSSTSEGGTANTVENAEPVTKYSSAGKPGFWKKVSKKLGTEIDENATEAEKKRLKMARNTKIGSAIVLVSCGVGFIVFCLYYGRRKRDEQGNYLEDEFTGLMLAPFYRILKSLKDWRDYVTEPSREVLLPDPLPEQLQPKYTLVIEMKHILIAPEWTYKTGHRFKKRPALDYFLDMVGYPNFEVVIYTSEAAMTANPVIDSFDPKQRIMYRLYRDCTKYMKGHHIKDLSRLNRDLTKVIYIDYDPESFQLNPENVLRLPKWDGDMDDTSLVDLAELLKTIYLSNVEDVRPTLQYYSQFDDPLKEFRQRAIYLAEQERLEKERLAENGNSVLKRYSGRLFGYHRHS